MSEQIKPTIPITVEFNSALSALANARGVQSFERRLASELSSLLKRIGLSGEPSVKVLSSDSTRAVRVRVHGTLQPYEPYLMKGVWLAVAPTDLRGLPDTQETVRKPGFPDGWFTDYVAGLSAPKSDLGLAFEYLTRLVIEIIAERAGCLVGPEQAAAYLKTVANQTPQAETSFSEQEMLSLLKTLLNLGVYVTDKPLVWQIINVCKQFDRSVEDITESVFTQLRSPRIEIHAHPVYLDACVKASPAPEMDNASPGRFGTVRKFVTNVISTLSQRRSMSKPLPVYAEQVDERVRSWFRLVEEQLLSDLGLQLPELVWVASSEVQEGMIAFKINDRLEPPILGLQPGELLVNTSVKQLAELNVPGRSVTYPGIDTDYAIVSESHKETVEHNKFAAVDIYSFVPLISYVEAKRRAARLLAVEDIEYQLAQLRQSFPALIQAALARFSVGTLTQVMRGLVAEDISIRDPRSLLEPMLQFDTVTVDSTDYILFDERLELPKGRASERVDSWQNHCAFVRSTLKHFITYKYSQNQNSMPVYCIADRVQRRAEVSTINVHPTDAITWLDEAEQEALKDSIWDKVIPAEAGQSKTPILTSTNSRIPIRELLAGEMPAQPVVAVSELRPDSKIHILKTIELDV